MNDDAKIIKRLLGRGCDNDNFHISETTINESLEVCREGRWFKHIYGDCPEKIKLLTPKEAQKWLKKHDSKFSWRKAMKEVNQYLYLKGR